MCYDPKEMCFAELEKKVEVKVPNVPSVQDWYEEVRHKKLGEFDASDLARAIRHGLFLEFVVPIALEKMAWEGVIIGDYYGELMLAMLKVPENFWRTNEALADNLRVMILEFLNSVDELVATGRAIIDKLSRVYPWMAETLEKDEEE